MRTWVKKPVAASKQQSAGTQTPVAKATTAKKGSPSVVNSASTNAAKTKSPNAAQGSTEQPEKASSPPTEVILPTMGVYAVDLHNAKISELPLASVPSPVTLVEDSGDARIAVADIMRSLKDHSVLGFDIEVQPRFKKGEALKPPSVMQIATEEHVYVFHLTKMSTGFQQFKDDHGVQSPIQQAIKILQPILNSDDKRTYKCGMGVKDDAKLLKRFAPGLETRDFVCMQHPALKAGFKRRGLRVLTAILLGKQLSKKQQISSWGQADLSAAQVEYAATDAWVSREIALKLESLWLPEAQKRYSSNIPLMRPPLHPSKGGRL